MHGPAFDIKGTVPAAQLTVSGNITFPEYGATMRVGDQLMSLYNLNDINKNSTLRFRDAGTGQVIAKLYDIKKQHPLAKCALIVWRELPANDGGMEVKSFQIGWSEGLTVHYVTDKSGLQEFSFLY